MLRTSRSIKKLAFAIAFIIAATSSVHAQTGSVKTTSQLIAEINQLFPDQLTGAITPFNARQTFLDMIVSLNTANDISTVIGSAAKFFNPTFFGNAATGNVYRFNRVKVGTATLSSSDIPQSTPDWLETLGQSFSSEGQLTAISAIGDLGIVGAARCSDFRTWAGSASGGCQGVSGFSNNDDNATSAASATVGAGGSGYTNGSQVLTVVGGTCTVQPLFNVTVSGNAVTAVASLNNGGDCATAPANPASTSGGGGTGATLNVIYSRGTPVGAALYGQAFHSVTAGIGVSEAGELNISSSVAVTDITPFGGVVGGNTFATNTSVGTTGFNSNASAAHIITQGGGGTTAKFRKGIVIVNGSLDTSLGSGTNGVGEEFPRGTSWRTLNSGGTTDAEFWGDASGIHLAGGGNATGCTINSTNSMLCASATSFFPSITVNNTTADGNSASFVGYKNRAGGAVNSGDTLAGLAAQAFTNAQTTVGLAQFSTTGAVSGANVPTAFTIKTGTAAGLLNNTLQFDSNAHLSFTQATAPTANACAGFALGAGQQSDEAGSVTFTSATSCAINFGTTHANPPSCTVSPGSAASTVLVTRTTSVLTATFGTAQTAMSWICHGA